MTSARDRLRRRLDAMRGSYRFEHWQTFHSGCDLSELFERDGPKLAEIRHHSYQRKHQLPTFWRCVPTGAGAGRGLPMLPMAETSGLPVRSLAKRQRAILRWLAPWLAPGNGAPPRLPPNHDPDDPHWRHLNRPGASVVCLFPFQRFLRPEIIQDSRRPALPVWWRNYPGTDPAREHSTPASWPDSIDSPAS